jgi:HSP20 family molecular chaperone IbpA
MPNTPYDELLKNLARLIEQVTSLEQNMRHLQNKESEYHQIFGCAIISGGIPMDQEIPIKRHVEVNYEIVDAGDIAYLTVCLPSSLSERPEVEFQERSVLISAASSRAPVNLDFNILPDSCSYSFRNGIVDVTLVKTDLCPESEE